MLKLRTFVALSMATLLSGSVLAAPTARPAATKITTATAGVTHGGRTIISVACALVSYRTACELIFGGLPTAGSGYQTHGMGDSPEGVDPLVSKGRNLPPATTQNSRLPNP